MLSGPFQKLICEEKWRGDPMTSVAGLMEESNQLRTGHIITKTIACRQQELTNVGYVVYKQNDLMSYIIEYKSGSGARLIHLSMVHSRTADASLFLLIN